MSFLNKLIVGTLPFIPKKIVGYFASQYIAGEKLEDGVRVVKELNQKGMKATMDVLGEGVSTKEESLDMRRQCAEVLDAINQHKLNSTLSIKPTQMGMAIDKLFCLENVRFLSERAEKYHTEICLDMEDHPYTDGTLEIYETLRAEHPNVTAVIQAYLRRSENDVLNLVRKSSSIRLCKGIYVEPESIAFKDREEIRSNYKKLMHLMVDHGAFIAIATHDDPLIEETYRVIDKRKLTSSKYEFQMLLGVREQLRNKIVADGHPMRVYVPFGKQWYAYSTRRLKENPQMAGYVFRSIFGLDGKSRYLFHRVSSKQNRISTSHTLQT